jgi:hypothetical protein
MKWIALAMPALLTTLVGLTGCGSDTAQPPSDDFTPDPPAVYVAKAKNVLVGLPPTDAEIAQVTADPKALPGLIDAWMQLPEYQRKMAVFFALAFQQTQITEADFVDMIPPRGLGNGRSVPALLQNIRESFARTVLQLVAEGRPLTDAFTTRRLMMTPALMELYAFLDTQQITNEGRLVDSFARAHPGLRITLQTAAGPVPTSQSVDPTSANFMRWYTPDLPGLSYAQPGCTGLDPITFAPASVFIHAMLYGEVPNHAGPQGNCPARSGPATAQVVASDFTSWRMVTLRPPDGGESRSVFYDLEALRAATELVLTTPKPGFFSTPAFFANWPTNQSNQMRVTVNQALIVATGAQVDGTDDTAPSQTPGLDRDHASDGACIGCHRLLDPTRSILASTYSWFYYAQSDPLLIQEPGLFAFHNVIAPVRTIDDFARLLATHPLVAQGWTQKLCYYVNSAPCDPSDPELQRIVTNFSAGFSWPGLVRDLLASPITTSAARTTTTTTNGQVIAVARRDHLCAAINHRLGFVDICQLDATFQARRGARISPIAQIVSGMPSDGYGRGATIPVLPNDPNLFYRAGIENVCRAVAELVVDARPDPNQPGVKQWSSSQPDAAIADFVAIVIGTPASDPRAAQLTAALASHFTAARATSATPTDSLRSTFVAACLSPSFIGIGM